jgi:GTP-binding protein
LNLHNAEFIRSAVKIADFPQDDLPQIAFAGKSNVGKSSTINRLLNRKNFARVGNSPGKTIHINFFLIDKTAYFVDLPGYGYAKVSKQEKDRWGRLMQEYFDCEDALTMGIQIVDIRHKPTADDVVMSQWFLQTGVPYLVIANKSDKIKKSQLNASLNVIRETLKLPEEVEVIPFSAEKGDNRDYILEQIESHIAE